MTDLPKAISEAVVDIDGVGLRVSVLDDGRRVIHAGDLHRLLRQRQDPLMSKTLLEAIARQIANQIQSR